MFTIQDILDATKGKLIGGNLSGKVTGVSIDSRAIKPEDLFIAIKGDQFDGHDFVGKIIEQGVRTVVVSKRVTIKQRDVGVILVKDTTKALGHLAQYHRMRFNIPVIGITGSAGKTTTKEMIAAVLKTELNVLFNVGTENNHIGVPLTLLKLTKRHEAAVIEMGTNQPGDISWLAEIANPTIAVLTNIGESHLEKLKNLNGVFREKLKLAQKIGKSGYVIYNNDDSFLNKVRDQKLQARCVCYSIQAQSDYKASQLLLGRSGSLTFQTQKKPYLLKTFSVDMAYNALASIACARILNIQVGNIQKALRRFRFQKGRQELLNCGGIHLINDSYNANPVSMRSAVKTLDLFPTKKRRILICADMLELGRHTKRLHQQIGDCVAASHIDVLMTMGEYSRWIVESAQRSKASLVVFNFTNIDHLNQYLRVLCQKGDVVLVKGSRRMKMEKVVEFLMNELRN